MKRNQMKATSAPITVGVGVLLSFVITVLAAILIAMMIIGERMDQNQIHLGSAATLLLASFVGTFYVVITMGEKRLLFSAVSGGVYFLLLLLVTLLCFEGVYANVWQALIMVIGGSISAGIIKMNSKKTSYRIWKKRSRNR